MILSKTEEVAELMNIAWMSSQFLKNHGYKRDSEDHYQVFEMLRSMYKMLKGW